VNAPTGSLNPNGGRALVGSRNVTAYYGDLQALFGISLEVNAGEDRHAHRANGAGKTTSCA